MNRVDPTALEAANEMEKAGRPPSVQLAAAKVASGQKNLTYKPHQGEREKAHRLARRGDVV